MAMNATRAAGRIIVATVQGKPVLVASAVFAARLAICRECPKVHVHSDGVSLRCNACGCWLNGKHFAKASLATETCPLNRWEAVP